MKNNWFSPIPLPDNSFVRLFLLSYFTFGTVFLIWLCNYIDKRLAEYKGVWALLLMNFIGRLIIFSVLLAVFVYGSVFFINALAHAADFYLSRRVKDKNGLGFSHLSQEDKEITLPVKYHPEMVGLWFFPTLIAVGVTIYAYCSTSIEPRDKPFMLMLIYPIAFAMILGNWSCLKLTEEGFAFLPFTFFRRNKFIPWGDISGVILTTRYLTIFLKQNSGSISLRKGLYLKVSIQNFLRVLKKKNPSIRLSESSKKYLES